jgi:hypothetical protein
MAKAELQQDTKLARLGHAHHKNVMPSVGLPIEPYVALDFLPDAQCV